MENEKLCPDCDHKVSLHEDRYGCQYEFGDAWVSDSNGNEALVAQGPCGCKSVRTSA
jgi:hypothetical protein